MDILKTAREIGFFETGINLKDVLNSAEVVDKVAYDLPLPNINIQDDINEIVTWLADFNKTKYMFLTPEIALVEKLAQVDEKKNYESIILMSCDMENEMSERLTNNLPKEMPVSLLNEPYFPNAFYPSNGMLIACGYTAGGRLMVLPETYRMIEHYRGFMGKKVFIPYVDLDEAIRCNGWMEISNDNFNAVWRGEQ